MPDQATIDDVGAKFQEWASSLPANEQEVLAEWMSRTGGDEVRGYDSNWWTEGGAWSHAWNSWWTA